MGIPIFRLFDELKDSSNSVSLCCWCQLCNSSSQSEHCSGVLMAVILLMTSSKSLLAVSFGLVLKYTLHWRFT
jgi:hypothetical protein